MTIPIRVLMIEDSEADSALLLRELRAGGYDVQWKRVDTSPALKSAWHSQDWDVVISDFSMPEFSGGGALQFIRATGSDVPFIFVSGTVGEETAVAALKDGAQEYVMKTNLKRLVPAVKRELRDSEERREHKRLEQHVQQLQKFEAIGRLAGGVAHDFNNIIGAILGWAEMGYEEAQPDSRLRDRFRKIREQSERAGKLTSQLLAFGRKQILQPRKLNLNVLIQQAMNLLERLIGENIEIRVVPGANLRITLADPTQMDQVVMNLCLNARDAMPKGGKLVIETDNVEIGEEYCRHHVYGRPGSYVRLCVSDTGTGMDAATVERVFEPFFTTKELGRGTGLGLATVYGIIKQHGGFIYVYSEPGNGTSFKIYLRSESGDHEPRKIAVIDQCFKGTETILFAEDHQGLRDSAQEMLTSLGYHLLVARDGREAVESFIKNSEKIDLVVLDAVMPRLSGLEASQKMQALRPGVEVIFTTGYAQEAASIVGLLEKGSTIVQKPYSLAALSRTIREALDRRTPAEAKPQPATQTAPLRGRYLTR